MKSFQKLNKDFEICMNVYGLDPQVVIVITYG